ncbi:MAG: hypothetical protein EA396_00230 [Anaerolineaceae bacterium]|nr:MAG: hypothetical protein EA396_00230 [Anaerolineaceae bacterium]
MTPISPPPAVRRWLKSDTDALEAQLKYALTTPQNIPSDVALWITRFAHDVLRPRLTVTGDAAIDQNRVWVCFALRYLHPMLTGAAKLVSHEAMTNIIKNHYNIVQTLVEGDVDAVIRVLRDGLLQAGAVSDDDDGHYPDYLHKIADREERTFARSADKGRDQLIAALVASRTVQPNASAESVRTYLSGKRPEQVHRALQSHHRRYRELLQQSADDPERQHAIALSLAEFERRLDMVDHFRGWDSRVLFGAEVIMVISVLGMDVTPRTTFLLVMVLGFIIACLFYTRTAYAITDADSWARKELAMLGQGQG